MRNVHLVKCCGMVCSWAQLGEGHGGRAPPLFQTVGK